MVADRQNMESLRSLSFLDRVRQGMVYETAEQHKERRSVANDTAPMERIYSKEREAKQAS